jgi:hypothetical protein
MRQTKAAMFVCKECAERTGWTYHLEWSKGLCELCERERVCDDIKRPPPAKAGSLQAIRAEKIERRIAAVKWAASRT